MFAFEKKPTNSHKENKIVRCKRIQIQENLKKKNIPKVSIKKMPQISQLLSLNQIFFQINDYRKCNSILGNAKMYSPELEG